MTTVIPTEHLTPEQSFLWKRPGATEHPPILEIITPETPEELGHGVLDFVVAGAGHFAFVLTLVEPREVYGHYLELLVMADEKEQESLKKFLPKFKKAIISNKAKNAVVFGGGISGLVDIVALSYHEYEDEAAAEFKRVTDAVRKGDLSVIIADNEPAPIMCLDEGVELLTSPTSSTGNGPVSPN